MILVSPHIVCFRANNPSPMTLDGTNCYIVYSYGDALLIDVGPDEPAHLAAMADHIRQHQLHLRAILLTHTHRDHTDGLDAFREMLSAPVYAFKAGYDHQLHDGQILDIGRRSPRVRRGWTLDVIHTPGHAGDCVCFFDERDGVLLAGDTILGIGTSVIAPPEGDVSAYLDSLERLQTFPAKIIAPGHGPLLTDPRAKIDEYIAHRLMRERQIVAQLQTGPKTVAELVAEIYKEVDPKLHGAAAWSVSAHLKRLERAGKIKWSDSQRVEWAGDKDQTTT